MLTVNLTPKEGQIDAKIKPIDSISISPTATSLHYGISCFEGVGVSLNETTNNLQFFRLDDHLESFYRSSVHLDMPRFDKEDLKK